MFGRFESDRFTQVLLYRQTGSAFFNEQDLVHVIFQKLTI